MRIKKMLVLDRDSNTLKHLSTLLIQKGYSPILCQGGANGLNHIDNDQFALAFIDVAMQDSDGFNLIKAFRSRNPLAAIVLTCKENEMNLLVNGIEYEICNVLVKPFEELECYEKLDSAKDWFVNRLNLRLRSRALEHTLRERTKQVLQAKEDAMIKDSLQDFIHSIIDPLTVIVGRAQLMKSEMEHLSINTTSMGESAGMVDKGHILQILNRINQSLDNIHKNSQRIFQVVDNVLLSAVEKGHGANTKIDINELILKEIEFFKSDVNFKHRVKKFYYMDPFLERIDIKYNQLRKAVDNIVENSLFAMNDSKIKQLTIATYQDEENIYISFHHTGNSLKQIPDMGDDSGAISERYVLETCRKLMKPYYGDIEFEHKLGVGSTFRIILPRYLSASNPEEKIQGLISRLQDNRVLTG